MRSGRVGRREPQRVLAEDDGVRRGAAARGRVAGSGSHPARKLGVGQLGGERQVEHAKLVVRRRLRERRVELAPVSRARPLDRRGGNQRMGRADAVAVDHQHARVHGVVERVRPRDRGELREPGVGRERDGEQEPPNRWPEARDPRAEELLHRVGQRQVVDGVERPSLRERATDLEREERVAERRVGDPTDELPGEIEAEPLREHTPEGAHAQRLHLEPCEPARPECRLEGRLSLRPRREEEADGDALEPTRRVRQRVGRRAIEPLDVVDRDEEGLPGGKRAQGAEEADRDRRPLGRRPRRRRAEERDLERVQLRGREAAELVRRDPVEQVDQRRERVLGLGVGRSCREDAEPVLARCVDARLPERRLPDAGAADEHERRRCPGREELSNPRELGLAADERGAARTRRDAAAPQAARPPRAPSTDARGRGPGRACGARGPSAPRLGSFPSSSASARRNDS